ncbi:hypothetical protein [Lacimicrobium sp. SS2-24]|uniref:hypothetical protein n=1 Tax=Lacimicrobium sp. SS2-24 TaxID=2005569 RepID=UPI000B4C10C3|nr:hypothetical protein [Lacimicrobium sp. SS2-24]
MRENLFVLLLLVFGSLTVQAQIVRPAPLVSIATHDAFFEKIQAHCGNAYAGKVAVDSPPQPGFEGPLVMHIRQCQPHQLHIPFHVADDHSRTWILTKTGSGISLKHDHRDEDGSYDSLTMYGGHTTDAGWDNVQSFPADQYSRELFVKEGLPQSNTNVWKIYIYPERFTYRLIREGREFRVDFDLTKPVTPPLPPWGYE